MSTIQEMKKRLLQLRGKEIVLAKEAITENIELAVDLIAGQLAQGMLKDGTKSDYPYSPFTIASKKRKSGLSSVVDHLTNYDTGDSYRQLYGKVKSSDIEFGTKTDKEAAISDRMDGKAFGLAPDSKEEFIRQHVKVSFIKKVRDIVKI